MVNGCVHTMDKQTIDTYEGFCYQITDRSRPDATVIKLDIIDFKTASKIVMGKVKIEELAENQLYTVRWPRDDGDQIRIEITTSDSTRDKTIDLATMQEILLLLKLETPPATIAETKKSLESFLDKGSSSYLIFTRKLEELIQRS